MLLSRSSVQLCLFLSLVLCSCRIDFCADSEFLSRLPPSDRPPVTGPTLRIPLSPPPARPPARARLPSPGSQRRRLYQLSSTPAMIITPTSGVCLLAIRVPAYGRLVSWFSVGDQPETIGHSRALCRQRRRLVG